MAAKVATETSQYQLALPALLLRRLSACARRGHRTLTSEVYARTALSLEKNPQRITCPGGQRQKGVNLHLRPPAAMLDALRAVGGDDLTREWQMRLALSLKDRPRL